MSEREEQRSGRGRMLTGHAVSPGYGAGTAYVYHPGASPAPPHRTIDAREIESEDERLIAAIEAAIRELRDVQERVSTEIGEPEAQIFAAHLALLEDQDFVHKLRTRIAADHVNAEGALDREARALAGLLAEVDNEYLRERAHDIADIKNRVLRHLGHGPAEILRQLPPATVLVARELLPSDTLNLDRAHVTALVLEHGAGTGHAAILARAMGIPAVGSVSDLLDLVSDGASVLVDGERGEVVVDPDPAQAASFTLSRTRYELTTSEFVSEESRHCVTLDGHRVTLLANVGRPSEAEQVERHHLAGVGLFRTEYLFMQAREAPSFELQREVYRGILEALGDRPTVIRTLDVGGDKQPEFAIAGFGGSAGSGMRGLRLSLHEGELFRTQVRAIVDAGRNRRVAILLPMVTTAEEVARAVAAIDEVANALGVTRPPVGAMLETPSVLFELEEVLSRVDFASIGTNDLVQFMLAIERRTVESLSEEAIFQPAILRAIDHVVQRAAARNKPLTVCGEAAGDPRAACLLVGLGIDSLSMSPVRAARVSAAIRRRRLGDLQQLARAALGAATRNEVMRIVSASSGSELPGA